MITNKRYPFLRYNQLNQAQRKIASEILCVPPRCPALYEYMVRQAKPDTIPELVRCRRRKDKEFEDVQDGNPYGRRASCRSYAPPQQFETKDTDEPWVGSTETRCTRCLRMVSWFENQSYYNQENAPDRNE